MWRALPAVKRCLLSHSPHHFLNLWPPVVLLTLPFPPQGFQSGTNPSIHLNRGGSQCHPIIIDPTWQHWTQPRHQREARSCSHPWIHSFDVLKCKTCAKRQGTLTSCLTTRHYRVSVSVSESILNISPFHMVTEISLLIFIPWRTIRFSWHRSHREHDTHTPSVRDVASSHTYQFLPMVHGGKVKAAQRRQLLIPKLQVEQVQWWGTPFLLQTHSISNMITHRLTLYLFLQDCRTMKPNTKSKMKQIGYYGY